MLGVQNKKQYLFWHMFFAVLLLLLHGFLLLNAEQRLEGEARQITQQVSNALQDDIALSRSALMELKSDFEAHKYDKARLLEKMNSLVDQHHNWLVRFAWTDPQGGLAIGSVAGAYEERIDLSQRAYIQAATKTPGKVHFDMVRHIVNQSLIIIQAVGVRDAAGASRGTLTALLDGNNEADRLRGYTSKADVHISIAGKNGVSLIAADEEVGNAVANEWVEGFFNVKGYVADAAYAQLRIDRVQWAAITLLAYAILVSLLWRSLHRYFQRIMQPFFALAGVSADEDAGKAVLATTSRIHALLTERKQAMAQSDHYKEQLHEALELIHHFQKQQSDFFKTMHAEMEQVIDAMEAYGEMADATGQRFEQLRKHMPTHLLMHNPSALLSAADHMREVKEHMAFLSQCLHVMCEQAETARNSEIHERVDMHSMLSALLNEYSEHALVGFSADMDACELKAADEQVCYLLLRAFIGLAVVYAEKDAHFSLKTEEGKLVLALDMDLAEIEDPYAGSVLSPQMAEHFRPEYKVRQHIYYFLLGYFVRSQNGNIFIGARENQVIIGITIPC